MPSATLIIAFYNQPDYLALILAGLQRQSFQDFEVIIADDGSNEAALARVKTLITETRLTMRHVWQEDKGFRKNRILNRALMAAESDYLIFFDTDCIPHREFVKEHFQKRRRKVCLTGRRVNLSEKISRRLTPELIRRGYLERHSVKLLLDGLIGKTSDAEKGIYIRRDFLRRLLNRKRRGLLGSNFSLHKQDILEINGFDERYEAYSIGEDSDVQFRLELNGVVIQSLNQIAIQYHLYHPQNETPPVNLDLFRSIKKERRAYTRFGIVRDQTPTV